MSEQICDDGHRCENGSMCTENPNDEGSYYCDCDETLDEAFAGIMCEHQATSYCTMTGEVSHTSFCTNGGQCTVKVSNGDAAHVACNCLNDYEGDHCQFIRATGQYRFYQNTLARAAPVAPSGGGGGNGSVVALLVLLLLGVIGALGFLVYQKKKALSTPLEKAGNKSATAELALDADGGVLKESIQMSENGSNHHVPPVVDDLEGSITTTENAVDDIDPKEMEDIQISNSNELL